MSYQELFIKKCIEAVKSEDLALAYVPKELKTPEICMEAVKSNGYALEYVPEELKTPEICMEAVKSNGYALKKCARRTKNTRNMYGSSKE